ncbi:hypothetical protein ABZP36_008499 [Zizania latifolia]
MLVPHQELPAADAAQPMEGVWWDLKESSAALHVELDLCTVLSNVYVIDYGLAKKYRDLQTRFLRKMVVKLVVDDVSYDFVKGATADYGEELIRLAFVRARSWQQPSPVHGSLSWAAVSRLAHVVMQPVKKLPSSLPCNHAIVLQPIPVNSLLSCATGNGVSVERSRVSMETIPFDSLVLVELLGHWSVDAHIFLL